MKYLVMCEGPNETAVMNTLIDNGFLDITRDDLLELRVFHARQIKSNAVVKTALDLYPDSVTILRVGDTMNDELKIPREYKDKIVECKKYCTKPELEILVIISEGLVNDYNKMQSRKSPKCFCKEYVKFNGKKYDNSTKFYTDYFSDGNKLKQAILEYKRIHKHCKDEHYLAELLK